MTLPIHLVIYFSGTGETGCGFLSRSSLFLAPASNTVQTIIVAGCDSPEVCDNSFSPNLYKFAKRFVTKLITHDRGEMFLATKDPSSLGVGIQNFESLLLSTLNSVQLFKNMFSVSENKDEIKKFIIFLRELVQQSDPEIHTKIADKLAALNGINSPVDVQLLQKFKNWGRYFLRIYKITALDDVSYRPISKVTLIGYSRGAVTTFEVAKLLNKRQVDEGVPLVPVAIIADQPVPGNSFVVPGTNAASVLDCKSLDNIDSVTVILAAYSPEISEELNFSSRHVHKYFFSQILPEFRRDLKPKLIVIPRKNHWTNFARDSLSIELAKVLYQEGLVPQKYVDEMVQEFRGSYHENLYRNASSVLAYPAAHNFQSVFGVSSINLLYEHYDEYHPAPYLRGGFDWDIGYEKLLDCWHRNYPGNSFGSEFLKLLETLNSVDAAIMPYIKEVQVQLQASWGKNVPENMLLKNEALSLSFSMVKDELKKLYEETGNWLPVNRGHTKEYLVTSLRTCLFFHLINLKVPKNELSPVHSAQPIQVSQAPLVHVFGLFAYVDGNSRKRAIDHAIKEAVKSADNACQLARTRAGSVTDYLSLTARALIRSITENGSLGSKRESYINCYLTLHKQAMSLEETAFKKTLGILMPGPIEANYSKCIPTVSYGFDT